jgi:hypothetical protein
MALTMTHAMVAIKMTNKCQAWRFKPSGTGVNHSAVASRKIPSCLILAVLIVINPHGF